MIDVVFDVSGLEQAFSSLEGSLDRRLRQGFEAQLEAIAARAKQTTTFVDRAGLLRNSIISDGVQGDLAGGMTGVISFAAANNGFYYGVIQEFGGRHISEKRFIRDAIEAEGTTLIEAAINQAYKDAGFEVG